MIHLKNNLNFSKQSPITQDTIPFVLSEFNNTIFKAVLNNKDTLNLKFDSGTTGLLLTNDVIENKIQWSRNAKFDNHLQLGDLSWDSLRIYPVQLSGRGRMGALAGIYLMGKSVGITIQVNLNNGSITWKRDHDLRNIQKQIGAKSSFTCFVFLYEYVSL